MEDRVLVLVKYQVKEKEMITAGALILHESLYRKNMYLALSQKMRGNSVFVLV